MSATSPHPLPPHPSLRLHHSSWWGTEAPPYPREREDEEEDDAEGWGPKPELSVRWQKLSNTTIAISHSPSLSDYTDHYTAAAVCVGVCLCGEGGFWRGLCWRWRRRGTWLWFYTFSQSSRLLSLCLHNRRRSRWDIRTHTHSWFWIWSLEVRCVVGQDWNKNEAICFRINICYCHYSTILP